VLLLLSLVRNLDLTEVLDIADAFLNRGGCFLELALDLLPELMVVSLSP
jgi:hypothetical protein